MYVFFIYIQDMLYYCFTIDLYPGLMGAADITWLQDFMQNQQMFYENMC